jgi:hypothetical protein
MHIGCQTHGRHNRWCDNNLQDRLYIGDSIGRGNFDKTGTHCRQDLPDGLVPRDTVSIRPC